MRAPAVQAKIGPTLGEDVLKDRRPRTDRKGGTENREPQTWQEAYEVIAELERIRASTRAIAEKTSVSQVAALAEEETEKVR